MRREGERHVDVAVRRILAHGPDVVRAAAVYGSEGIVASDTDVRTVDLFPALAIGRISRRNEQNGCAGPERWQEISHVAPPIWSSRRAGPSAPRFLCRR